MERQLLQEEPRRMGYLRDLIAKWNELQPMLPVSPVAAREADRVLARVFERVQAIPGGGLEIQWSFDTLVVTVRLADDGTRVWIVEPRNR